MKLEKIDWWMVFMSQTGTELLSIVEEVKFMPGKVVTNDLSKAKPQFIKFCSDNNIELISLNRKPTIKSYLSLDIDNIRLITLHGYLRILPKEFLEKYQYLIYNGHPALITKYPELKGFNKQEDVFTYKEKYNEIGSIIHRVIPELDSGKVIIEASAPNTCTSVDDAYNLLRKTSLETWKKFFKDFNNNSSSWIATHQNVYNL